MSNELADRQFEYLLNAMENAAQSASPALQGYGEKRKAVLDYVAALRSEPVAWTAHGIKREDTCIWMQDSDGTWNTSCGKVFEFTNAGPAENEANFCYHCGGALLPEPYSDDAAPSREPTHLYQCCDCGRKSWDKSDELAHCNFPQPNGKRCAGQMLPIAPSREDRTDRQEPGLSADAETKAAYIKHFGTDAGWLGEQGSYFIEGVRVGRGDMALRSLTARDEGIELTIKAFIDRYGYNKDQYLVSMLRALKGGQP